MLLLIKNLPPMVNLPQNHDNNIDVEAIDSLRNCVYLQDSMTEFEGVLIWGTPWSLTFEGINPKCTAFTGKESDLEKHYKKIPKDIDILISHGPPHMILDTIIDSETGKEKDVGSFALRQVIDVIKPKLFVCGHIHDQGGKELLYKHQGPNTMCVNCSYVNEHYMPVNRPMRVNL